MSEVKDLILPILQRMQADIADLKKGQERLEGRFDSLTERMDAFEGYFTFTMGLTEQNKADIAVVRRKFRDFEKRLETVETKS